MNVVSALFITIGTVALLIGESTNQPGDITVGQTFHFPYVLVGDIMLTPSVTLVKADWELCTFNIRGYSNGRIERTISLTLRMSFDGIIAGNLRAKMICFGEKLSVEYYFMKLELAI